MFHTLRRSLLGACCLVLACGGWQGVAWSAAGGKLKIVVVDKDTGKPIPCRIHLKNQAGVAQKAGPLPFWHDHFVCNGEIELAFRKGNYTFEIERGLEYVWQKGYFIINDNAQDEKKIELRRFINMAEKGWYSGDLHIHRPVKDVPLLMEAEDLHIGPVITWWNEKNTWTGEQKPPVETLIKLPENRWYDVMAGEDERGGGALLYFGLKEPLAITSAKREWPSPLTFARAARAANPSVWIDAEKPFWWDVPAWVAAGMVDSIGIANNHMCREKMYPDEAWGRPRDKLRFRDPLGNGLYSQDIYYQLLNCGIRLPPSAGSASGVLHNPVGYNRVYVQIDGEFTPEKWWQGLRAGRSFVTNGPLLQPTVEGEFPGHTFTAEKGASLTLEAFLSLSTRDKISYLEVVQDGEVRHSIRLDEYAKLGGKMPAVTFTRSGWFLIRALTDQEKTFRFASTAPYYVKIGDDVRISKRSAQFFLDWVNTRIEHLEKSLADAPADDRTAVLDFHLDARKYWEELLKKANAD